MAKKRGKTDVQLPFGFDGGGVCPKEFQTCRSCRGNKVLPFGAPGRRTNVGCTECSGDGVKLYAIHTPVVVAQVRGQGTELDGVTTTVVTETTECRVCRHRETVERIERKGVQANG